MRARVSAVRGRLRSVGGLLLLTAGAWAAVATLSAAANEMGRFPRRPGPGRRGGLQDTGVTTCANASAGGLPCNSATAGTDQFPGQDAENGRDVIANQDGDGHAGFSFVKLGPSGTPLPDQSATYDVTPWPCIQDLVTGLVWEVHTDDGGLRDRDWTYSWYNSTGRNDGGNAGLANGGICLAGAGCDTEKFVEAVNAAGLCGHADWRLPDREELRTLQLTQNNNVRYLGDPAYFPEPTLTGFGTRPKWTSTPTLDGETAWQMYTVGASKSFKRGRSPVRLVRGGN